MAHIRKNHWGKAALLSVASSFALITGTAAAQTPAAQAQVQQIDLPAAALSKTLIELGDILGVNILAEEALVAGKTAPLISGSLSATEAIERALINTDLVARPSRSGAIIVTQRIVETTERSTNRQPTPASLREEPLISETIVVTGSRLERTAVNSPAPIDIITADDIAVLGLTDNTEALRFVPALSASSSLSDQGNAGSTGPALVGLATLDLRGLGTNRTLVLVDGRRHVGGVAESATVDVSSIPSALIDRVEVLTGGGSSIYGADAVSGVVNYVLKDDFEGVDVRANTSLPTNGGGEAFYGAVTMGGNFADGRGNAVVGVEYNRQTRLQVQDRTASAQSSFVVSNSPELAAALGIDPNFQNILLPNAAFGAVTTGAAFSLTGVETFSATLPTVAGGTPLIGGVPTRQIVDPNTGEIRAFAPVQAFSGFFTQGGDGIRQPYANPRTETIPDVDRFVVNALADYDFNEKVTGFLEAKYSRNEAAGREATPFQVYDLPIQLDNPFIPQVVRDQIDSLQSQGIDTSPIITRLFYEDETAAPNTNIRETFRIVGGFEGELSDALAYEISANYGRTDTSLNQPAEGVPDRIYAGLDVIEDPNTGEPICRSDIDPIFPEIGFFRQPAVLDFRSFIPGSGACAPQNVFAQFGDLNPDFVDFAFLRTEVEFELEQFVLNSVIRGDSRNFLTLPAGSIGYAAGVEYREEKSESRPDPLQIARLGRGGSFASPTITGGRFDVIEGFAEVNVPVLADLPFAKRLTLDASVRMADYSTVGTATSYAVGGVWQPVDDFRIRASFNRSVRAPNIQELFSPQAVFAGAIDNGGDPCDPNNINSGSANRAENCAQLIPDLANFDPSPSYIAGGVIEVEGGNPNLSEETADTFTIGFAFTPTSIPGLSMVADYYDIEISDAISGVTNDLVFLANCVDAGTINNPFCAAVTRNPNTGVIERFQRTNLNFSASTAQGIDYQIAYDFNLDRLVSSGAGSFTAQIGGTYLIDRTDQLFAGFPETNDRLDGELVYPKHFLNVGLSWNKGPWSADYGFNYQSSQSFGGFLGAFGIEEIQENSLLLDRPKTGSSFVHYLGGAYQLNEDLQFSVRVNNLLDRDPFELRSPQNPIRPVSFLGRTVQLGVQAKF